jgi:hypothetical protein
MPTGVDGWASFPAFTARVSHCSVISFPVLALTHFFQGIRVPGPDWPIVFCAIMSFFEMPADRQPGASIVRC